MKGIIFGLNTKNTYINWNQSTQFSLLLHTNQVSTMQVKGEGDDGEVRVTKNYLSYITQFLFCGEW